ncbi:maestro heat-like repeat-containing protein family member 1 [Eurosta solidaginis]|uniref:maestro heat-like repeat-containing protein family member 1 n=1 Tax=Eurosta solidaginis TaxID=178769 RepID=UPI0035313F82
MHCVAYDVLFNQWLSSRELKVCVEILQALSSMYPLLPVEPTILDPVADQLISSLFDLACLYPDYEKSQTVKGHYEALFCFHLLAKMVDTLLKSLSKHL